MDIGDDVFHAHVLERIPVPVVLGTCLGRDRQGPLVRPDIGSEAGREHGPVVDERLARWQPGVTGAATTAEPAIDHCHGSLLCMSYASWASSRDADGHWDVRGGAGLSPDRGLAAGAGLDRRANPGP